MFVVHVDIKQNAAKAAYVRPTRLSVRTLDSQSRKQSSTLWRVTNSCYNQFMCKSCTGIEKNSIVIYYDKKLQRKRKAKVVAVNRWHLTVRPYKSKKLEQIWAMNPAKLAYS